MINGAHAIICSRKPEADRAFFQDVLKLTLMCGNITRFIAAMKKKSVRSEPVRNLGWGLLTRIRLPGGGKLGVYQPRHARPRAMTGKPAKPRK